MAGSGPSGFQVEQGGHAAGIERGKWREADREAKGPENAVTAALEDLLLDKMGSESWVLAEAWPCWLLG